MIGTRYIDYGMREAVREECGCLAGQSMGEPILTTMPDCGLEKHSRGSFTTLIVIS